MFKLFIEKNKNHVNALKEEIISKPDAYFLKPFSSSTDFMEKFISIFSFPLYSFITSIIYLLQAVISFITSLYVLLAKNNKKTQVGFIDSKNRLLTSLDIFISSIIISPMIAISFILRTTITVFFLFNTSKLNTHKDQPIPLLLALREHNLMLDKVNADLETVKKACVYCNEELNALNRALDRQPLSRASIKKMMDRKKANKFCYPQIKNDELSFLMRDLMESYPELNEFEVDKQGVAYVIATTAACMEHHEKVMFLAEQYVSKNHDAIRLIRQEQENESPLNLVNYRC